MKNWIKNPSKKTLFLANLFSLLSKGIALLALVIVSCSKAHAHDFPAKEVEYICRTAMFYITYDQSDCIKEQFAWFDKAVQSPHYEGALWYGQRRNWRGEVVGIDFKYVLDRVEYLK